MASDHWFERIRALFIETLSKIPHADFEDDIENAESLELTLSEEIPDPSTPGVLKSVTLRFAVEFDKAGMDMAIPNVDPAIWFDHFKPKLEEIVHDLPVRNHRGNPCTFAQAMLDMVQDGHEVEGLNATMFSFNDSANEASVYVENTDELITFEIDE